MRLVNKNLKKNYILYFLEMQSMKYLNDTTPHFALKFKNIKLKTVENSHAKSIIIYIFN